MRRRRLLSAFAAVSLACAMFVTILWCRSYGLGEAIQWRSTRWVADDRRIARSLALLTRDGLLTLDYQREDRRIAFAARFTPDQREPRQTTFHWDWNYFMDAAAPRPDFLDRLGFSKFAAAQTLPLSRSRTATQVVYRYTLPFCFLTVILLLPPTYWICRRTRSRLSTQIPSESPPSPNHGEIA
jgi:hypothetical protein